MMRKAVAVGVTTLLFAGCGLSPEAKEYRKAMHDYVDLQLREDLAEKAEDEAATSRLEAAALAIGGIAVRKHATQVKIAATFLHADMFMSRTAAQFAWVGGMPTFGAKAQGRAQHDLTCLVGLFGTADSGTYAIPDECKN